MQSNSVPGTRRNADDPAEPDDLHEICPWVGAPPRRSALPMRHSADGLAANVAPSSSNALCTVLRRDIRINLLSLFAGISFSNGDKHLRHEMRPNLFGGVQRRDMHEAVVLLTVYERTLYLKEAIDSALAQTYHRLKIIVLDDSNNKEIASICGSYARHGIIYSPSPVHQGVVRSLIRGIQQSSSEYLAILNDDDVWEAGFIENMVRNLDKRPECNLAFCDHWIIDHNGKILDGRTRDNTKTYHRDTLPEGYIDNLPHLVINYNSIPLAMASVFRRSALPLELLFPEVGGAYDLWISLLLATRNCTAFYTKTRLTRYREHELSESARQSPNKLDNLVFLYRKALELGIHPAYSRELRARLATIEGLSALQYLRYSKESEAWRLALTGLPSRFSRHKLFALMLLVMPRGVPTGFL